VIPSRPLVAHVTTTDISLELLLGPQLEAFAAAGYDVVGISAPGPYVDALARRGIRHVPLQHATRAFAPVDDARALAELVGVFRRLRPAIVHTHNPKPGVYGRVADDTLRPWIAQNTGTGVSAGASRASRRAKARRAKRRAAQRRWALEHHTPLGTRFVTVPELASA